MRMVLRMPLTTAHGTTSGRDVLLVQVVDDEGRHGWAECGAQPDPSYWPEYVDGALDVLRRHLVPRLFSGAGIAVVAGHQMASGALADAVLDLELRSTGRSLADELGATATSVPAGAVVGVGTSTDAVLDEAAALVAAGYRCLKLKVAGPDDVARVLAVRERVGEGVTLVADANEAFSANDLDVLRPLDGAGLACLEQPCPRDDLVGSAAVAQALRTPIALDESIGSAGDAAAAIALGAGRVVNVKAARVGGLRAARRVHDVCVDAGVACRIGGMLETGIGRAAAVTLGALPGFTVAGDLAASDRYWDEDLTEPFVLDDGGALSVPAGPVEVREDVLDRLTIAVEVHER